MIEHENRLLAACIANKEELDKLKSERAQLIALAQFGAWCFDAHRETFCDLDGSDLQQAAKFFGLIADIEVMEPCNADSCQCADLGDFPSRCYRTTPLAKLPEGIE